MNEAGKYESAVSLSEKKFKFSFYLLSVSGHFRDYGHNQDKCEAQNDRMKYHNCIQKHPLRVSVCRVHWWNILRSSFLLLQDQRESCVVYLFYNQDNKGEGWWW